MTHRAFPSSLAAWTLLIVLVLSALASASRASAGRPVPPPIARTVCVDAGHGGTDPGAVHFGLREKDLTLDIAQRLRTLLLAANYNVVMTRTGDQSLGNTDRANICNAGRADSVISIHLNASSDPSVDYFKAFYGKLNKDRDFTQAIWDRYSLTRPNSSEPLPKSSIAQFASGLLLKANAPACLAETVFLSNPDEARALSDGAGNRQQQIAQELFNGLDAWYNR
jgi:N-acetylmuramoyl-L-alanine amidase